MSSPPNHTSSEFPSAIDPDRRANRLARVGLVLSSLLVLVADFPWGDLQNHSHWGRVGLIPFVSPPLRLRDIVLNTLLCAPVGGFAGRMFRRPLLSAVVWTLLLSVTGEWTQIYSHTRFPSATDVTCNVAGALAAATFMRRILSAPTE